MGKTIKELLIGRKYKDAGGIYEIENLDEDRGETYLVIKYEDGRKERKNLSFAYKYNREVESKN